jgi:hypothetical protein
MPDGAVPQTGTWTGNSAGCMVETKTSLPRTTRFGFATLQPFATTDPRSKPTSMSAARLESASGTYRVGRTEFRSRRTHHSSIQSSAENPPSCCW